MAISGTDLEAASAPDQVANILQNAAQKYLESSIELGYAWQDEKPSKVWTRIAKELERAATRIEQICNQEYGFK